MFPKPLPLHLGTPPAARRDDGFTLVELMVVLAVLAVLAGIAFPNFQSLLASTRLTTAANEVLLGLNYARSEAVRRNTTVYFCMGTSGGEWNVHQNAGQDLRAGTLSNAVSTAAVNLDTTLIDDAACVRFRADGLAYGAGSLLMTNGRITLTVGDASRVVNVRTGSTYVG